MKWHIIQVQLRRLCEVEQYKQASAMLRLSQICAYAFALLASPPQNLKALYDQYVKQQCEESLTNRKQKKTCLFAPCCLSLTILVPFFVCCDYSY